MVSDPSDDRRITYFASTHTRGKREMFGIRAADRMKHMYIIGKTGVGKSTMLENMAIQDIQNGEGVIFIDPHGSTAEKLLDFIPYERIKDVIYFAPFDVEYPLGFNIMENVGFDQRHNVVSNLMGVFERLWADAWSPRMTYILQNTLLALLEYPDSTMVDINRMLVNKVFRAAVVEKVTDPIVRSFWTEEFAQYTDRYTQEATPAIQNKVGQLVSNPLVRNIIAQPKSSFDMREVMDGRKIFIANLSKGRMGDANSTLIGAVLVVRAYIAAMSRASVPAPVMRNLPACFFYVDEFQNLVNRAFTNILSESRKYKLALTIANQYIKQMEDKENDTAVKDAVFGNVGTTIVFKVGPLDAEELEPLFDPTFTIEDMVGLGVGQIYLTLSIDGITSPPFSAETIPPIETPRISYRDDIVRYTREHYGRPRAEVEKLINERLALFAPLPKEEKKPRGFGPSPFPVRSQNGGTNAFPRSTPRPGPQVQAAPARPRPEDERNALRAAIDAARPETPARSPLDVLREKSMVKPTPVPRSPHKHPQPSSVSGLVRPPVQAVPK
ncbi:MAG TPA: type IV secretion system DNA-binding domain-containing protein, partial [Candidatus Paceibacterota bacterium]|nr:type IV secretion system DNA-binding domain-containing protein [Candidatus Paceibacterota bacterium]